MKTSSNGVKHIKKLEHLELVAYYDSGGVLTNGYGHTGDDVFEGQNIVEAQADMWLRADLREAETCISTKVKVTLEQHQFDALVSFIFNVGCDAFRKSTLLKLLNQGNYDDVPAQMSRWNKDNGKVVRGLTNRRNKEIFLWNGDGNDEFSNKRPTPAVPKPLSQTRTLQGAAFSGVGIMGATLVESAESLTAVSEVSEWLKVVCALIAVAGTLLVVWGRLRIRKEHDV